jgi:type II secretory pathway pseudopilin PulG
MVHKEAATRRETDRSVLGLTLIEVMITLTVLGFLLLVVARSQVTVSDANSALHGVNRIALETQTAVANIHKDISTARKLFQDDVQGRSYLAALGTMDLPAILSTRLPVIGPLAEFSKDDPATPLTGNCLLMAEEMTPNDTVVDVAGVPTTYRVNIIRLVAYYLTRYDRPLAPGLSRFDLVRWESQAFVDHTTLTAITNATTRQAVVANLTDNARIYYSWDILKNANLAFFELGNDVAATAENPFSIPASPLNERAPKGLFANARASISSNNTSTGEAQIPKFAVALDPSVDINGIGFPHGFEVKIVGPSGARKVLVRVVADIQRGMSVVRSASETKGTMRDL